MKSDWLHIVTRRAWPLACVLAVGAGVSGCSGGLASMPGGWRVQQSLINAGLMKPPADAVVMSDDGAVMSGPIHEEVVMGPHDHGTLSHDGMHPDALVTGPDEFGRQILLTGGTAPDRTGYMGRGPAVTGKKLSLKPGQTASEKALELQAELAESQTREEELQAQVAELQAEVDRKNARLVEAIREMNATRQELIGVRGQLESWSQNMNQLREKVQAAEADNLATMQTIIELLQQFLQVESDMRVRQRAPIDLENILDQQKQGGGGPGT